MADVAFAVAIKNANYTSFRVVVSFETKFALV